MGEPEILSTLDLLKLARQAGGVFISLTDEVLGRVNGARFDLEMEAIDALGEDSPATGSEP